MAEKTREQFVEAILNENGIRKSRGAELAANAVLDAIGDNAFKEYFSVDVAERVTELTNMVQSLTEQCSLLKEEIESSRSKLRTTKEFMENFGEFHGNLINSMSEKQRSCISAYTYMMSIAAATRNVETKDAITTTACKYFMASMTEDKRETSN